MLSPIVSGPPQSAPHCRILGGEPVLDPLQQRIPEPSIATELAQFRELVEQAENALERQGSGPTPTGTIVEEATTRPVAHRWLRDAEHLCRAQRLPETARYTREVQRVVVDDVGGPEVLAVVEEEDPEPGPGEVCVRVLAAGVSFTDMLIRAGTYLGGPKPPFTPGYELVGVVEELGRGCSRLRQGDRVAALTVTGAYAERVCIAEEIAVPVPTDLDPAELVSLVLTYVTAYQLLHRVARANNGEAVLVHGAAGRVGTAVLELGALAELRVYGTASADVGALVERLGGVPIDYRREDFLARVRELTGEGVDIVLDGIGGALSLRSYRALRPGGRLVIYGHHATLADGRKSRRGWISWYASTGCVGLAGLLSRRRSVLAYRIAKLRDRHPDWFRDDLLELVGLLHERKIKPHIAERLPLGDARRAHELLANSAVEGKLVLVP